MVKISSSALFATIIFMSISNAVDISEKISWHCAFPTIGLLKSERLTYPFLPHQFTLHELAPHQGEGVRLAILDSDLNSAHGSHINSLIAGPHGISPKVQIIMIKAFDNNGVSKKKTIIKAVQTARKKRADIILLSCKIDDGINPQAPASRLLEQELGSIPYVIAASGNDGCKYQRQFLSTPTLAYPARFATTTFSAGAFGIQGARARIPEFSQYEIEKGPDFVLPGVNISAGKDTLSGTSGAAALLAGCIALMLGEAKDALSHDQICLILSSSTLLLENTPIWRRASLTGTVDMRMALFMTRVLATIKHRLKNFDAHFDTLLEQLRELLVTPAQDYADDYLGGTSFTNDFMQYCHKARVHEPFQRSDDTARTYTRYTLSMAIKQYADKLLKRH